MTFQITIPADRCEEFRTTFLEPALMLDAGTHMEHLKIGLKAEETQKLRDLDAQCRGKTTLILNENDLQLVLLFKWAMDTYSKPHHMPRFGKGDYDRIVAANAYLDQLIPPEIKSQPSLTP